MVWSSATSLRKMNTDMPRYFTKMSKPDFQEMVEDRFMQAFFKLAKENAYVEEFINDIEPGETLALEDFVYKYFCGTSYDERDMIVQKGDLTKIKFDCENVECKFRGYTHSEEPPVGIRTISNGLTFLGVYAGGDWEHPIFFILYPDGKDLRGYIPKKGNHWNKKTKEAYGNDEDSDPEDWYDDPELNEWDGDALIADIMKRIQLRP